MRAVLQRVKSASVQVDQKTVGKISEGWLVYLGLCPEDREKDRDYITDKILNTRSFRDSEGKLNLSVSDIGGEILIVSQFTLYGDCRKGRRPSFSSASPIDLAKSQYEDFLANLKTTTNLTIESGTFQASMEVSLINDGPVTLLLDSQRNF